MQIYSKIIMMCFKNDKRTEMPMIIILVIMIIVIIRIGS